LNRAWPRDIGLLAALALLLLAVAAWSLAAGAAAVPIGEVLAVLGAKLRGSAAASSTAEAIVLDIRAPRLVLGIVVGAALAVSGAVSQALFRNPLADPSLLGVLGGATLGAATMIVLGHRVAAWLPWADASAAVPFAAFATGLAVTACVLAVARRAAHTNLATVLLGGIAVNAIVGSLTGFLTYLADDDKLRSLTFWTLGSLGGATWSSVAISVPLMLVAVAVGLALARPLNALSLGEAPARHLGVAVERVKWIAIVVVALAAGASVAAVGMIGFVGLVSPQIVRLVVGADHRLVLPATGLLGAILLVAADVTARTLVPPAELPLGVITAGIGGPFFLWLLVRMKGGASL
jgi:iron complex transport system permease protein